jgi:hypothetical protein
LDDAAVAIELARDLPSEPRGFVHHLVKFVKELLETCRGEQLWIRHPGRTRYRNDMWAVKLSG